MKNGLQFIDQQDTRLIIIGNQYNHNKEKHLPIKMNPTAMKNVSIYPLTGSLFLP